MPINGIDISNWNGQAGFSPSMVDCDFVIAKATQGTYYKDRYFAGFMDDAISSEKLVGAYHFASAKSLPETQAEFFVSAVKPYIGHIMPFLDWENDESYDPEVLAQGPEFAKRWLDAVYRMTGSKPAIYMSKSVCREWDWSDVAAEYPLWCAQYANNRKVSGFKKEPWTDDGGFGAWAEPLIYQYTSELVLPGWGLRLDGNIGYLTRDEWAARAAGNMGGEVDEDSKGDDRVKLAVDGYWGEKTTAALQDYFGIETNSLKNNRGFVQHQWPTNKQGAFTTGWMYDRTGIGDEVVVALQNWLEIGADGLMGPHTIKFLQRKMGTVIDGELWAKSPCVMEMQRRLNEGRL